MPQKTNLSGKPKAFFQRIESISHQKKEKSDKDLLNREQWRKNKYYVVWKGITPGVYDNWGECKAQVDGQDGAKYKSFETKEEATKAFEKRIRALSENSVFLQSGCRPDSKSSGRETDLGKPLCGCCL